MLVNLLCNHVVDIGSTFICNEVQYVTASAETFSSEILLLPVGVADCLAPTRAPRSSQIALLC